MAKKSVLIGLIFLFIIGSTGIAHCDDALKKLGRGACNVVTCPLEITNQIQKTNNSDGPMAAFTWGVLKGVGMIALRGVVGVYEVATFPIPIPACYKPILTDPEFFFEDQIA